jgi:S1-C subfamily serine protease
MARKFGIQVFPWMLGLAVGSVFIFDAARADTDAGEKAYQTTLKGTAWIVVPRPGPSPTQRLVSTGSGVLIDSTHRLVVTNFHVVGNENKVFVLFPIMRKGRPVAESSEYWNQLKNDQAIRGEVIARDTRRDLAIVRLASLPPGTVPLRLAREGASPGQRVHSVGNPGRSGALWLYTSGTVRQVYHKHWQIKEREKIYSLDAEVVETQSPTNPGDSGGPLVNDRGELVGITQGHAVDAQLLSLFIDVSEVREVLRQHKITAKVAPAVAARESTEEPPKPGTHSPVARVEDGALVDEHRATTKLNFAKTLAADGKIERAKDRCEEIINSYPNTKAATEAKQLLEKLSK